MFAEKTMESSTTTGTGAYSLGTAVGAFQQWRATVATGTVVFYYAENGDGTIWEAGFGTLTLGSPDTLSRTLINSSTGALINWAAADAPIYIMSVPMATVLKHLSLGGRASALPAWLQRGGRWFNDSDANAWSTTRGIDLLYNGSTSAELGRYEATPGIYVSSPRRPTLAVGAAGLTLTAHHVGWRLTLDTTAATRTLTLPAIATVDKGFMVSGLGLSSANGVVITPNGSDVVDFGSAGGTLTIPGKVPFDIWSDGTQWRTNYVASTLASDLSSSVNWTTWTPIDSSGASLSFSSVNAKYTRIGNLIFAFFSLTFPATGSGAAITIGGLPVAVPNQSYGRNDAVVDIFGTGTGGNYVILARPVINSSTFIVYGSGTGASVANSSFSTLTISGCLVYPAS